MAMKLQNEGRTFPTTNELRAEVIRIGRDITKLKETRNTVFVYSASISELEVRLEAIEGKFVELSDVTGRN